MSIAVVGQKTRVDLLRYGPAGGPELTIQLPGDRMARDIRFGPDGLLYAPLLRTLPAEGTGAGTIVAVDGTTGAIVRSYPLPVPSSPWEITISDGDLFYTDRNRPTIGRLDLAGGGVTEYLLRTSTSTSRPNGGGIAAGPNGDIWYTNWAGAVGRLRLRGDSTSVEGAMVATAGITTPVRCAAACTGTARSQITRPAGSGARAAQAARTRWATVGSARFTRRAAADDFVRVRPSARYSRRQPHAERRRRA